MSERQMFIMEKETDLVNRILAKRPENRNTTARFLKRNEK